MIKIFKNVKSTLFNFACYNQTNSQKIENIQQRLTEQLTIMGNSSTMIDNTTNTILQQQKMFRSPNTSSSQKYYSQYYDKDNEEINPIIIPYFLIRQSPFKIHIEREEEQKKKKLFQGFHSSNLPQQQKISNTNSNLWYYAFYDISTVFRIFDYLPCKDIINLSYVNKRVYSQCYFYRLFHRQNNWDFVMYMIESKSNRQGRQTFNKLFNQCSNQDSQHSLDLDRLDSFFTSDQDITDQLIRVDKIMRVLNAKGIQYFQGLNSIVVFLVNLFDEQTAYWITLLLITKTSNIQNNQQLYQKVIKKIEKQVKSKCQKCYNKLIEYDLGVQYFAMKWLMGLFSYDLSRHVLLHFWDLIINFGLSALEWLIVSMFKCLEQQILLMEVDQFNQMLKSQLQSKINGEIALKIARLARIYFTNQIYGEGSSQIFGQWTTSMLLSQNIFTGPMVNKNLHSKNKIQAIKIDPIDQQAPQQQQQQQQEIVQQPKLSAFLQQQISLKQKQQFKEIQQNTQQLNKQKQQEQLFIKEYQQQHYYQQKHQQHEQHLKQQQYNRQPQYQQEQVKKIQQQQQQYESYSMKQATKNTEQPTKQDKISDHYEKKEEGQSQIDRIQHQNNINIQEYQEQGQENKKENQLVDQIQINKQPKL